MSRLRSELPHAMFVSPTAYIIIDAALASLDDMSECYGLQLLLLNSLSCAATELGGAESSEAATQLSASTYRTSRDLQLKLLDSSLRQAEQLARKYGREVVHLSDLLSASFQQLQTEFAVVEIERLESLVEAAAEKMRTIESHKIREESRALEMWFAVVTVHLNGEEFRDNLYRSFADAVRSMRSIERRAGLVPPAEQPSQETTYIWIFFPERMFDIARVAIRTSREAPPWSIS